MKKLQKSPLIAAMGTALVTSMAATPAQAESNPFGMSEMSSGYMQVAEKGWSVVPYKGKEAVCGEGQCGAMMDGDKMKKGLEKTCGAMMKGKEGACGMDKPMQCMKGEEMTCGEKCMKGDEMKCGANKKGEMKCGANMKGGEMTCGEKVK